jgi:predicted alpha-1,2-mannosidase
MDTKIFVERGYVPYDNSLHFGAHPGGAEFCCSHTLEYSFSAYAVAQWAKQLGKMDDYETLMNLARGWERIFDNSLGLVRPRTPDGEWIDNFDPLESWRGFQEGNAMQYTFFVPQDPEWLIARMGRDKFNARLDSIFTVARESVFGGGKVVNAFSGLQSPYNHGNQPNLHISWLFNFSGKPWLTQKWTRLICDEFYGTDGEHGYGYGQDEDQGQLGAWYVMAAMGLFDVQGGTSTAPTLQLGSPQFDRITISLNPLNSNGDEFVIQTKGNGPGNYYVQSARLNERELDECWLLNETLHNGGTLELTMGPQPATEWGADVPPPYAR